MTQRNSTLLNILLMLAFGAILVLWSNSIYKLCTAKPKLEPPPIPRVDGSIAAARSNALVRIYWAMGTTTNEALIASLRQMEYAMTNTVP